MRKAMEYVDAPSGFVTLYNYKEPYMRFAEGHGFQGVLLMDGKTEDVQCHFCGEWFSYLSHHIHKEHNMTALQYKDKVGLNRSSALIGEKYRAKLISKGLEKRMKNLRPGKKKTSREKAQIGATLKRNTREMQNITGTCPEQLLDRLKKKAEELGRTPGSRDITFEMTLKKVFGSFAEAKKRAGLAARKPGMNVRWEEITDEKLLQEIREFNEREGRLPTGSDIRRKILPHVEKTYISHFGSLKKAAELALEIT